MTDEVIVLLDLNVVLDVMAKRHPHYSELQRVWAAIETGRVRGMLAAHSVTTLYYLLSKHLDRQRAEASLRDVLQVFSVAKVDETVIQSALALGWEDFEDAVQMAAAAEAGAAYLITRNVKDFGGGPLPALTPGELMADLLGSVVST
jgi:predicted nucleic acid-binding protein